MILTRSPKPPALPIALWLLLGVAMWAGIALLAGPMFATVPPTAGFDLELLLAAGREVAAGRSPYHPAIVAGFAPSAISLFYSYPPIVAQATAFIAPLPSGLVFATWPVVAVAGVGTAALALRARLGVDLDGRVVLAGSVAGAALVLPFTVGLLWGNLDVFFPLLYGLLLAGCLSTRPRDQALAGVAFALAALTKIHPASLGLWLVARLVRARREQGIAPFVRILAAAAATAALLVGISVVIGGPGTWREYARMVAVLGGADMLYQGNYGPATQLALLVGGDNGLVRLLHLPVALGAVGLTVWAALRRRDTLESLAWAAAASLFVLPVTWYHYPAAMIPFGIAAVLRAHGTPAAFSVAVLVGSACLLAALGLVWAPLLWAAVALVVAAAGRSADTLS